LEGNHVELEKVVISPTFMTYFLADCHSCLEQLAFLSGQSQFIEPGLLFILVSHSNPFELKELKSRYKIEFPILYDHWNQFGSNLKIDTYPFNILVDSGLVVREIIPGELLESDYWEVIKKP